MGPQGSQAAFHETCCIWEAVSLISPDLKGSSQTASELICKPDLKIPWHVFTKKLVSLYGMWKSITKPRVQTFQGFRTVVCWQKRKLLVLKLLKLAVIFFINSFPPLYTSVTQTATVILYFKYCNIDLLLKEKKLYSHHTKYYIFLTTNTKT